MAICESSYDIDLVFRLIDYFNSDVILLPRDGRNGMLDLDGNFEKVFDKTYTSSYKNIMVISTFRSGLIDKLIDVQNHIISLMASAIWINFIEKDESISDAIQDLMIPFNSRFFTLQKLDAFTYEITDVYQISPNSSKIYSRFATWKNGELDAFQGYFYSRRMNLRGHEIKTAHPTPLSNTDPRKDIWEMNFSLNRDFPTFGNVHSNGSKTGVLKLIDDHVVDATIPGFVYTQLRADHFDYIFPTEMLEVKIYFRTTHELNWASYMAPFSTGVWLAIIIWIVIAALLMHIIVLILNKFDKNEKINLGDSILDVTKALCSQGGNLKIDKISFYISYFMSYLLAVILLQYYSGGLLSYLTVKNPVLPFKDLKGVIEYKAYKISVLDTTYALFFFKTDSGKEARDVRKHKLLVPDKQLPKNHSAGFQQICENRWVYLCVSFDLVIKAKCDLVEVNGVIFDQSQGIIVRKGFPYKNVMIKMMKKLQLAGLLSIKRKNTMLRYHSPENFTPITIEAVFPIFLLYLSVLILSGIILLLEVKYT